MERFWTIFQEPLQQAALIEDGKIVKLIPNSPPRTPARFVSCVGRYNDSLVIGRKNSVELWDWKGEILKSSIYHPWIYRLHDVKQIGDNLLLGCCRIDAMFSINLDAELQWSWFAHEYDLSPQFTAINEPNWTMRHICGEIIEHPGESHLNSVNYQDDTFWISLLKKQMAVKYHQGKIETIPVEENGIHDYQLIDGKVCYGYDDGCILGEHKFTGFPWVKRIKKHNEHIFFSYEQGVVKTKGDQVVEIIPLPRPFGIVF